MTILASSNEPEGSDDNRRSTNRRRNLTILASSNEPEGSDDNRRSTNRRRTMTILASSQMNLKAQMVTYGRLTDDGL